MQLTNELKARIDAKTYKELLFGNRFAPAGDQMFLGESGIYWLNRMRELRAEPGGDARHTMASKSIGWH